MMADGKGFWNKLGEIGEAMGLVELEPAGESSGASGSPPPPDSRSTETDPSRDPRAAEPTGATTVVDAVGDAASTEPPSAGTGTVSLGAPFDEIYKQRGVPKPRYKVEQAISYFRAQTERGWNRQTQVQAFADAAEVSEDWSLDDVRADAEKKLAALRQFREDIERDLMSPAEEFGTQIEALEQKEALLEAFLTQKLEEWRDARAEFEKRAADSRTRVLAEADRVESQISAIQGAMEMLDAARGANRGR